MQDNYTNGYMMPNLVNKKLQKEKRALERKLKRAELLLEIQKKAAELMGIELDQQLPDDES